MPSRNRSAGSAPYKHCHPESDATCETTGELWWSCLLVLCEAAEVVERWPAQALPDASRPQVPSPARLLTDVTTAAPSPAIADPAQTMPATFERQSRDTPARQAQVSCQCRSLFLRTWFAACVLRCLPCSRANRPPTACLPCRRTQGTMANAGLFSGLQVSPAVHLAPSNPVWANAPLRLTPDAAKVASHVSPSAQAAAQRGPGDLGSFDLSCTSALTAMLATQLHQQLQHGTDAGCSRHGRTDNGGSSGGSDITNMAEHGHGSVLDLYAWHAANPAHSDLPVELPELPKPAAKHTKRARGAKPARASGGKRSRACADTDSDEDGAPAQRPTKRPSNPATDLKKPTIVRCSCTPL